MNKLSTALTKRGLCLFMSASLVLALTVSALAITVPQGKSGDDFVNEAKAHVQSLTAEQLTGFMNSTDDFVLLDIRSFAEFEEHGWIAGRTVLPHGLVIFKITEIVPNKDVPIIVYCKKGKRSALVTYQLKQVGYEDVRWLEGGVLGWKRKGLPVEQSGSSKIADGPVVPEGEIPSGRSADDFVAVANRAVKAVSPADAKQLLGSKDAVLLDIRTAQEIESQGAISGALVMEHGKIVFNIKKKVHDANTPLLVICKQGGRSALIAQQLQEMGYKDVHHIQGGIIAWKEAGLLVSN